MVVETVSALQTMMGASQTSQPVPVPPTATITPAAVALPTIAPLATAVPRVWEKFYSAVTIAIKEATPLQQLAYRWAIGVGQQVAQRYVDRQPISAWLKLRFLVGRWLVLPSSTSL